MLQNSVFEIATPAKATPVRKVAAHAQSFTAMPDVETGQSKAAFKPMLAHERAKQNGREKHNARDVEPSPANPNEQSIQKRSDKNAKLDQKTQQPHLSKDNKSDQKTEIASSEQEQKSTENLEHAQGVSSHSMRASIESAQASLDHAPEADEAHCEEMCTSPLLIAQAYVEAAPSDMSLIRFDDISLEGEVLSPSFAEGGEAALGLSTEMGGVTSESDVSGALAEEAVSATRPQLATGIEHSPQMLSQAAVASLPLTGEPVEALSEDAVLEKPLFIQASLEKTTPPIAAGEARPALANGLQALELSPSLDQATALKGETGESIEFDLARDAFRDTPRAPPSVPQVGARGQSADPILADRFTDIANTPYGMRGISEFARALEGASLEKATGLAPQHQAGHTLRPTPLQMLPIEIGMQVMRGANSFQIRLDPAELGRVDVKLDVNSQGEVNAHLIVERPETLQMLRRDATTLHYAFEQAGLKSTQDGLSFSLRGDGQNGQNQNQSQNGSAHSGSQEDDASLKTQIEHLPLRRVMIPHSSIDRMV